MKCSRLNLKWSKSKSVEPVDQLLDSNTGFPFLFPEASANTQFVYFHNILTMNKHPFDKILSYAQKNDPQGIHDMINK